MIDDDHSQPAAMGRGKTERKQIHRGQPSGMEREYPKVCVNLQTDVR